MIHSPAVPSLKAARLQKLLTQQELAAKSGVRQETIARIERGHQAASLRTIRALSAALERSPTEIDEFRASLGMS